MIAIRIVFIVCVSIFVASCLEFTYPLSNPNNADYDKRLIGTWKIKRISPPKYITDTYYHVGKKIHNQKNKIMSIIVIEHRSNGDIDQARYDMFISSLEQDKYKYIHIMTDNGYYILSYRFMGNQILEICEFKTSTFEKSIHNGKLKGGIVDKELSVIGISSKTDELLSFIRSSDKSELYTGCHKAEKI